MPYYKKKNLLFIHIPKTGGSFIEKQIKKICHQTLYSSERKNNLLDYPYNNASLQHQFFRTLYKFRNRLNINFNKIKVFTVVRNPYDRLVSDLFWFKKIEKNFTPDQVYYVIKYNYLNEKNLDNHTEPQYKFITDQNLKLIPGIKIFKCETLNESNKELNHFLGFNIDIRKENVNKNYSKYLNNKSISLINNIYKKDFEFFNYDFK